MNKRGFELSVNFIVILILCIAVFSFGMYFIAKLVLFANEKALEIDRDTEREIDSMLDTGNRVVIPRQQRTAERGDMEVFGVGVLNILGINDKDNFRVTIEKDGAIDKDGNQIINNLGIIDNLLEEVEIKNNENHKFTLGIEVPKNAEKGTYIFDVGVEYFNTVPEINDWQTYGGTGTLYKIRITVP